MRHAIHRRVGRITEPQILFPLVAACLLTGIWATTWDVLKVRRADAEHAAAVSTRELLSTYEAQVVRSLGDIDQALELVKLWPARSRHMLADLKDKGLLPPDLVFTVSITDSMGVIVESTRPTERTSVAEESVYLQQRRGDVFFVGQLPRGPTGNAKLQFSRRMNGPKEAFDGVVMVAVDANYFVSGYEPAKLGEHGVLGLLGMDGVFRVRRSGDLVVSGDTIDYPLQWQVLTRRRQTPR